LRGDDRALDYLNRSLRSELTAINQYWLHYRIFDNWCFKDLAKKWREESIEEMHHADRLTARILFLEGFPNLQVLDLGQTVEEILRCDLDTETAARGLYTEAAEYCVSAHDLVSKELYDELLIDEEKHIDFLERNGSSSNNSASSCTAKNILAGSKTANREFTVHSRDGPRGSRKRRRGLRTGGAV
jgi:bacterioferritin